MTDHEKAVFHNLSVYLEKVVETVLENQKFVVAIHKALATENPKFAVTCERYLDNPLPDTRKAQDQMEAWEKSVKDTLLALRNL